MNDRNHPPSARPETVTDPLALTLDQGLDRFVTQELPDRQLAARTRTEYVADLTHAFTALKQAGWASRVTEVTQGQLEHYLTDLKRRGLTRATQRRAATSLRVFFRFLHHAGYLAASPAERLVPPPRDAQRPRVLTPVECQRLLATARRHPRDLAILRLFLDTGIRRGELTGLLLTDVELPTAFPQRERGIGTLRVRTGTARTIPLIDLACRALDRYLANRPASDDPHLFLSRHRRGLGSWGVEDVVTTSVARAGINHASPQSLRHTFAVQQVRHGTALPTLQAILGHAHLATTRAYVALAREQMGR